MNNMRERVKRLVIHLYVFFVLLLIKEVNFDRKERLYCRWLPVSRKSMTACFGARC